MGQQLRKLGCKLSISTDVNDAVIARLYIYRWVQGFCEERVMVFVKRF